MNNVPRSSAPVRCLTSLRRSSSSSTSGVSMTADNRKLIRAISPLIMLDLLFVIVASAAVRLLFTGAGERSMTLLLVLLVIAGVRIGVINRRFANPDTARFMKDDAK